MDPSAPVLPPQLQSSRLTLRPLEAGDIPAGDGTPAWYGDPVRRKHVWAPPMASNRYLRGLLQSCDWRERFAWLVERRSDGAAIGFVKGQITPLDSERVLLPTVVLGRPEDDGQRMGSEAVGLFVWYAIRRLGITRIRLQLYAENAATRRLAEAYGYRHTSTSQETMNGVTREVLVFEMTADRWLAEPSPGVSTFEEVGS